MISLALFKNKNIKYKNIKYKSHERLKLLHRNGSVSDENFTDTELEDDDIELGQQINHKLNESHGSLIENAHDDPIHDIDINYNNRCHEWIKATAWRIKQSVQFFVVYLVLIVLNAFVLIWVCI